MQGGCDFEQADVAQISISWIVCREKVVDTNALFVVAAWRMRILNLLGCAYETVGVAIHDPRRMSWLVVELQRVQNALWQGVNIWMYDR
jgi:hypothetical protein